LHDLGSHMINHSELIRPTSPIRINNDMLRPGSPREYGKFDTENILKSSLVIPQFFGQGENNENNKKTFYKVVDKSYFNLIDTIDLSLKKI